MAKYHEIGRFSLVEGEEEVDWDAALFHEEYAAQLGVLEAISTLARLHLGLQRDVLVNCTAQVRPHAPLSLSARGEKTRLFFLRFFFLSFFLSFSIFFFCEFFFLLVVGCLLLYC